MDQAAQPLCGVANLRDVGFTINRFLGERRMREGLLFRSARPDEATDQDKIVLRDVMGIGTIIDLRTRTEQLEQKQKFEAIASGEKDIAVGETPVFSRIRGVEYREISLAGKSFEKFLISLLTWWDFIKLIIFHTLGYRMPALRIIAQKVLKPRGLIGLGLDTIDHCQAEIYQTLLLFTSPQSLPALVHCTHGKDRSGLICVLILMILGVPRPAIEHDYSLSDVGLESIRDGMLEEFRSAGLPEEWSRTSTGMIAAAEAHLRERYGDVDGYLDQIGIDQVRRDKIRETLLY